MTIATNPEATGKLEEAWRDFHRAHPEVYAALVKLARELRAQGHQRLGISMLWEVLRWQRLRRTDPATARSPAERRFLNNNHRAFYAREIMRREADLAGVFETREQGAPGHEIPEDPGPPAIGSGRRAAPLPIREEADGSLALDLAPDSFAAAERWEDPAR